MSAWAHDYWKKTESQTVPVGLRLDWKIGEKLSSEILSMWDHVLVGYCRVGNCRVGYCLSGIVSWWENAVVGLCQCGKLSSGKLSVRNCRSGNLSGGKLSWNLLWPIVREKCCQVYVSITCLS